MKSDHSSEFLVAMTDDLHDMHDMQVYDVQSGQAVVVRCCLKLQMVTINNYNKYSMTVSFLSISSGKFTNIMQPVSGMLFCYLRNNCKFNVNTVH